MAQTQSERRRELLAATERDEHELEAAVEDLRQAVRRPLAFADRAKRTIAKDGTAWIAASALLGFWLGHRTR